MAIAESEVHVAGDVVALGARPRFGRLQASELDRGEARGLRADDRVFCAGVEKQGCRLSVYDGIQENHPVDGLERNVEGLVSLLRRYDTGEEEQPSEKGKCTLKCTRLGRF